MHTLRIQKKSFTCESPCESRGPCPLAQVKNKGHAIYNCLGCPISKFHKISLVPRPHLSYGLSRAGDTSHVKSLVLPSNEFLLMKSLASDTSQVKSRVKFKIFPMSFHL